MRHRVRGLYVITDGGDNASLLENVAAALAGGASVVQYRDKSSDASKRHAQARSIVALCRRQAALCIINDDIDLALAVDADGVHVGRDDAALAQARAALPGKLVGASCYNQLGLALAAEAVGADYVAFGRFFSSRTKPDAVQADFSLLALAKSRLAIPIVAIGGITPANGGEIVRAGADALAVVHSVMAQRDVKSAAEQFRPLFAA